MLTAFDSFELEETKTFYGAKFYIGKAHGQDLILFQSGVGLVNAAMTMQLALERFDIERILFSGVAGGLDPSLQKGDLSIPSTWHYYANGARFTMDPEAGEYRIPDFMKLRVSDAHLGGFFPYPEIMIRDGMDKPERIPNSKPTRN